MNYRWFCFLIIIIIISVFSLQTFAGDVLIVVDRFSHKDNAPLRFSLCNSEQNHQKRDDGYLDVEAELVETTDELRKYRIRNLPPGEYAISGYHDLNNNGKLERSGLLGKPKEPVGFSMLDVRRIWRYPKWDEVKFSLCEDVTPVTVHLVDKFGL